MRASCTSLRLFQKSPYFSSLTSKSYLPIWRRSYSTEDGISQGRFETIRDEMLKRPAQLTWDFMTPTNSLLFSTAISDFVPKHFLPTVYQRSGPHPEKVHPNTRLPSGHHLVYFPLQKPASELCPDGTDPFHSPGDPFTRRMWAGGSIEFFNRLKLDSTPVVCRETIDDVTVKGPEGQERIFVNVLREYVQKSDLDKLTNGESLTKGNISGIRELRSLVFMRGLTEEQAREDLANSLKPRERVVKGPHTPDFSLPLTPTTTLLFQYSALTYNAHKIHLSHPEAEGRRNLLVHGPLCLQLMLAAVGSRIGSADFILKIDYRNLAPLYVDEPMRICTRQIHPKLTENPRRPRTWAVWIEDQDGSLCVRGTALSEMINPESIKGERVL
ncbi:hypothetical protein F4804DRAFT_307805, partial [Jackrogersella minutella]